SRRRHTRFSRDWSSDVCSSDLIDLVKMPAMAKKAAEATIRPTPRLCPATGTVLEDETVASLLMRPPYRRTFRQRHVSREAELSKIGRASCRERVKIAVVARAVR